MSYFQQKFGSVVRIAAVGFALAWTAGCSRSDLGDLGYGGLLGGGATLGDGAAAGRGGSGGRGGSSGSGGNGGFGAEGGFAGAGGFGGDGGFGGFGGDGGFAGAGGFGGGGFGNFGGGGFGNFGGGGFGNVAGTGGGGPCNTDSDCGPAPNSCDIPICFGGSCGLSLRDADGDGHPAAACGGDDCNDLNPNAHPGMPEICGDGTDNDCNGVADCADPACAFVAQCSCIPAPGGENCKNGIDDDCDGAVDCNDADCVGTPSCGCKPSEAGMCGNGIDDDCNGLTDCADPACAQTQQCICMAQPENCSNGVDDDCDLLVDCADPDCQASGACLCTNPVAEVCNDGRDNDCDGDVDCADSDCTGSPFCKQCSVEICNNGIDDDCDGAIDCADSGCRFAPNCPPGPELCNNGLDDDRDGLIDCQDPDCANSPNCVLSQSSCLSPRLITASGSYTGDTTGNLGQTTGTCGGAAGEAVFKLVLRAPSEVRLDTIGSSFDTALYVRAGSCGFGREIGCDDDGANNNHASLVTFGILQPGTYFVFVDGFTVDQFRGPDQGPFVLNVSLTQNPREICDDGKDNDGDRFVDCADTDCRSFGKCSTCRAGGIAQPEFGVGACTNGIDDDCDGLTDCADSDCAASEAYKAECCNGVDDNGNGIVDELACRCASASDCDNGELCYLDTVGACLIPCTNFVGDICPFAAPGSTCNAASEQCEF